MQLGHRLDRRQHTGQYWSQELDYSVNMLSTGTQYLAGVFNILWKNEICLDGLGRIVGNLLFLNNMTVRLNHPFNQYIYYENLHHDEFSLALFIVLGYKKGIKGRNPCYSKA